MTRKAKISQLSAVKFLILAILIPGSFSVAMASYDDLGLIETWTGNFTINARANGGSKALGFDSVKESLAVSAQVTFDTKTVSRRSITWEGMATCNVSSSFYGKSSMPAAGVWGEEKGSDSRVFTTPARLVFHKRKNTYTINKLCKQAYRYETSRHGVGINERGGHETFSENGAHRVKFGDFHGFDIVFHGPIPDQGNHLIGGYDLTAGPADDLQGSQLKSLMQSMASLTGMDVSGKVEWSLLPGGVEKPEAWIEYEQEGEDWVPEDDNTVKAKISWKEDLKPSELRLTLYDISEEPGTCLNSEDSNTDPDLEFDNQNITQRFIIKKSGKTFIATKQDPSSPEESIIIRAGDFGAYGKLKAEIKVFGTWYQAAARPFALAYLPVPFDKNENFIADKWEKDVGVYSSNLPPEWDEDPYPAHQKNNGDGFTLYEEYRGFREEGHVFTKVDHEQVKNGHVRMDPMYKDVFILDQDHLFFEYYRAENPSRLNWHLITPDMMKQQGNLNTNPEFRWLNFNTSKKHFLRNQYALVIMDEGRMRESAGITFALPSCSVNPGEESAPQPLKCNYRVAIYRQFIIDFIQQSPFPKGKGMVLQEILTTTVIHEIGHALGIVHHTQAILPDRCRGLSDDERSGTACDPKTYGVQSCAMRYEEMLEYGKADIIPILKTEYCRSGQKFITSEADSNGKFIQYPSHNCYGQINIKGD